jgi:hypothetical protein
MANCLIEAGLKIDPDLDPPDAGNIYGYWESKRFREIISNHVDNIVGILGTTKQLYDLFSMYPDGYWIWKYPSAVAVLETIQVTDPRAIVICMDRNREAVVKSMIRHSEIKGGEPMKPEYYESYYDDRIESFHQYKGRKLLIRFEDLVDDPVLTTNRALEFIGVPQRVSNIKCLDRNEVHF